MGVASPRGRRGGSGQRMDKAVELRQDGMATGTPMARGRARFDQMSGRKAPTRIPDPAARVDGTAARTVDRANRSRPADR